ncbi:hypothetical protein [Singulisphaera acidiphila]|uniref:hypothetical protein n=1 Tax=Singulisphaera acidiphila TaxID=466153 RepID=UPI0003019F82|nr:hypothetical protein [Singulisphaera acidiphila]
MLMCLTQLRLEILHAELKRQPLRVRRGESRSEAVVLAFQAELVFLELLKSLVVNL